MTAKEEDHMQNGGAAAPTLAVGIQTDPVGNFKCPACGGEINAEGVAPFSSVVCPSCGAGASVPAKLANFLLLRLLGAGGMGGVYYARDEELGRFVAIKVMLQSLGDDPAFIENFRREAQAVAKLNHPNIAQIYSFGQEKGQPYIVMELVSGDRADAMLESAKRLQPALVMRIGLEIAQGLSAADEVGLVHGDIKPENILLDGKGQAKLVDFGLATVVHQSAGEGIWGTPYYIAPEKIRRQKVDARSDIYSLGATLFHMLTGKPPFEGETPVEVVKARLEKPAPDPRSLIPDLPEIVATTILRMLAVDRTERYPNYLSLISDLRKAAQELGGSASVTAGHPGGGRKIRFKKKKRGSAPDEPAAQESLPPPETKGRKLVFHKDSQGTARLKTTSPDMPVQAEEKEAVPPPTPEEIKARKVRARKRARKVAIIFLLLLLIAAAAAVGRAVYVFRSEEIARRAEFFALQRARADAAAFYQAISNNVERTIVIAQRGAPLEEEVQKAVEHITGARLVIAVAPPPEPEPKPTPESNPEAGEAAAPDGAEADVSERVDDGAENEGADVNATDEQVVEPPPPAEDPPPAEPEAPAHPVTIPARQALEHLANLSALNQQATDHLEAAAMLEEKVRNSRHSEETIGDVQELNSASKQTQEIAAAAKAAFDAASTRAGMVLDIRVRYQRQIEAREAAEREAQSRREEAERLEQEKLEYQARAAAEIQQAQNDSVEVKSAFFSANNYEGAVALLKQKRENYSTQEGREAIQRHFERYSSLAQMKEALITCMQESPYAWGWGFGTAARDIEKASVRGIFVKGSPQPFPWAEVVPAQMLKLVDYYLGLRTLRPRDRINMALGAAIYCDEFGPSGRERAQHYANRAMDTGMSRERFVRLLESGWH